MSGTVNGLGSTGAGLLPQALAGRQETAGTSASGTSSASGSPAIPAVPTTTSGAGASNSTNGSGTNTSTNSSTLGALSGRDTFLQLLVDQMKNQDPSSPMDNTTFVTELAQFNSVEQMITMSQAINKEVSAVQTNEAIGLLGRTVTYSAASSGSSSNSSIQQGTVTAMSMANGQIQLQVNGQAVSLSQITGAA